MISRVRPDRARFTTAVATEAIYASSQLLTEVTGEPVQANKAIVGRNAFAHEAGIHQHGMLANPLCYEIMTPASVGVGSDGSAAFFALAFAAALVVAAGFFAPSAARRGDAQRAQRLVNNSAVRSLELFMECGCW